RLIESVPKVALFAGSEVKSRTRFGAPDWDAKGSIGTIGRVLRLTGDDRFSGPGAPRRCPAVVMVEVVSTNRKSETLLFVSIRFPLLGQPPAAVGLPPLPHGSRRKLYCRRLPTIDGKFVPSRNRSQADPPRLFPKPTPSSLETVER